MQDRIRPLVGNNLQARYARGKNRYPGGSPNPSGENGTVKVNSSALFGPRVGWGPVTPLAKLAVRKLGK